MKGGEGIKIIKKKPQTTQNSDCTNAKNSLRKSNAHPGHEKIPPPRPGISPCGELGWIPTAAGAGRSPPGTPPPKRDGVHGATKGHFQLWRRGKKGKKAEKKKKKRLEKPQIP